MIRSVIKDLADSRLQSDSIALAASDVAKPAIVLAPHPDDETLGCGGLIASKRAMGVQVQVVFLTDGTASHAHPGGRRQLAAQRRSEARTACRTLGVDDDKVVFIDIPDGELEARFEQAVSAVSGLVSSSDASQIILPHSDEPPSDHRVVRRVVECSLSRVGRTAQLVMYPVWLWDQWPWTNPLAPPRVRHSWRQVLSTALRGRLGTRLLRTLTHRHDISAVLDRKRRALASHETQTVQQFGDPSWLVLADVAHGEWLDRLLQPTEYYAMATAGPDIPLTTEEIS